MKDLSLAELIIQHGSETRAANEYVELVENRNMVEQITNSAKQNESDAIIRNAPEGATEIWFGETERVGDYAKRAPSGEWLLYDVGDKRWYDASLADVQWRSHHNLSDLKKDSAAAHALALFVAKANTKEDVLSTVKSLAHKLQMKQWHIENLMEQNDDCQVIDARDAKDVLSEACEQIGSLANQRETLRGALNQAIELLVTALGEPEQITQSEIHELRTIEINVPGGDNEHGLQKYAEHIKHRMDTLCQ